MGHPSNHANGTLLTDLSAYVLINTDTGTFFGMGDAFNPPVECLFLYNSFLTNSLRTIDQKPQQLL